MLTHECSQLFGNMSVLGGEDYTGLVPAAQQPSPVLLSGLGFQGALEQFGSPTLLAVTAYQEMFGKKRMHLSVGEADAYPQDLNRMSQYRFETQANQFRLSP